MQVFSHSSSFNVPDLVTVASWICLKPRSGASCGCKTGKISKLSPSAQCSRGQLLDPKASNILILLKREKYELLVTFQSDTSKSRNADKNGSLYSLTSRGPVRVSDQLSLKLTKFYNNCQVGQLDFLAVKLIHNTWMQHHPAELGSNN